MEPDVKIPPHSQPKIEFEEGRKDDDRHQSNHENRSRPTLLAQAAGSPPLPFVVRGSKASGGPKNPRTDPYPQSFLSARYRFELHKRESQSLNYAERQKGGGKALGRYQFEPIALVQIGLLKADRKTWTGKFGVKSTQDFLDKPIAQEKALEAFMQDARRQLMVFKVWQNAGLTVQTPSGSVKVTTNGLLAAAHKEGPPRVRRYFRHIRQNGGKVNQSRAGAAFGAFRNIEERLRDFGPIDHRARP